MISPIKIAILWYDAERGLFAAFVPEELFIIHGLRVEK
jgi:hypothetical protein